MFIFLVFFLTILKKKMTGRILVRNSSQTAGPIATLFGWGNGKMRHLLKYSNIFEGRDFTTICLTTPLVTFMMRPETLATAYREKVIQALKRLTEDDPNREIFLMAFSQCGANVMASMINHLDNLSPQPFNIVGTIFDSGPMIYSKPATSYCLNAVFSSQSGAPSKVTKMVVGGAIRKLCEHQVSYNRFIMAFESTLLEYSSTRPQLFLCSSADNVIDVNYVLEFSRKRKERGVPVYIQVWDYCSHVGIFLKHPEEYEAAIANFIKVCFANKKQSTTECNMDPCSKQLDCEIDVKHQIH